MSNATNGLLATLSTFFLGMFLMVLYAPLGIFLMGASPLAGFIAYSGIHEQYVE